MACIPRAFLLLCFYVIVLYVGHTPGESQASTANVYDVTKYGAATSNSDNKDAFFAAWSAACGNTVLGNVTFLVPNGTFTVGPVDFTGPCLNGTAPVVVIDGVLQPARSIQPGSPWIRFINLNNLLVTGAGTLDGQGDQSWVQKVNPTSTLSLSKLTNTKVTGLRLVNSPGLHVHIYGSSQVVAEGIQLHTPGNTHNTDGIHVSHSTHISILNSVVGDGDDCVAILPGSSDVVINGLFCGPGHGISVGSLKVGEDVHGLVIKNCTMNGTSNGVRIKSSPGPSTISAYNITFEDITMVKVSNPIIIDQVYCPHHSCNGADQPSMVQISDVTFKNIVGTSSGKVGVKLLCSKAKPCKGIHLDNVNLTCGGKPCQSEIVNVEGMSPSPGPTAFLEEEANVKLRTQQLGQ